MYTIAEGMANVLADPIAVVIKACMKFLAVFTLLGTIFTFAPQGIGFFATVVPTLQNNAMWEVVGLLCIACSVKAIYSAWHMAKQLPITGTSASNVPASSAPVSGVATQA